MDDLSLLTEAERELGRVISGLAEDAETWLRSPTR
jgi:hypothetical protein